MKFRVTGTNHNTGARMTLEFEASAKAAAEQKARAAGMDVQHVQDVTDGEQEHHGSRHRGEDAGRQTGVHPVVKTLVMLALLCVAIYFGWPYVRGWVGR